MLYKRVELNLELVEKFVKLGVPRKQIFITGHSCGGLTTLLLMSNHPEKVGGGISYMQACFGKLSNNYNESDVAEYMKSIEIKITVQIGTGKKEFEVFTMDLTKKYIEINSDYRS